MRTFAQKSKATQHTESAKSTKPGRTLFGQNRDVHSILHLQRTIGNQAILRLLQSNAEEFEAVSATAGSTHFAHDFSQIPLHAISRAKIQPKANVSIPGDVHEQEAEQVADRVMRMPELRPQRVCACGGGCPKCKIQTEHLDQTKEPLQTKRVQDRGVAAPEAPPVVNEVLRSPAKPLDASARAFFEPRFGHSFDHVRVHTDAQAHRSAHALNAEAYTVGSQIVFGHGMAAVNTLRGGHVLAHELAHVVQQSAPTGDVPLHVQREARPQEQEWLPELNEILPGGGGLIRYSDEVKMLIDVFGKELEQHVRLIYADAAATRFTRNHGLPGIVALYDTRRGNRLNVAAARQALTNLPDRYQRDSLERLRLRPSPEAPPSFWFQDPASQRRGGGEGGRSMTISERRAQVQIERQLSQVGTDIFVRFAYPETEVSRGGASRRIASAKQAILQAIAQVVADLGSLPPWSSRAELREQETVRARLREALRGLSSSSPLNVYIATEPTPQELLAGQVAVFTDRVFVNLQDVGDPARLQAAIRMPLLMLRGGVIPTRGVDQQVPGASPADLQRSLLHEALHALLIRQSSDANAIWEANRAQLTVQGSPSASPKFVELVRKYLIAQEEVFAYENEASLYPPVSPEKARYDSFITNVERFLSRRQLTLNAVPRSIPVSQRVARQAVTWTITYQVPSGTVDLTVGEIQTIDLLLAFYPLR